MPGPNSTPWAVIRGVRVDGKTQLRRAKLRSGENCYAKPPKAPAAEAVPED